jgi:hypothetical protein
LRKKVTAKDKAEPALRDRGLGSREGFKVPELVGVAAEEKSRSRRVVKYLPPPMVKAKESIIAQIVKRTDRIGKIRTWLLLRVSALGNFVQGRWGKLQERG